MGAVFFFVFLGILFLVALFFVILNTILIIVWKVKKHKGKTPKKRWLVIPVVLLVINVIAVLVPIGYIGFLRHANSGNKPDSVDVESGTVLYWPMGEYEPTTNWFEMDGNKYVRFRDGFSDEPFFLDYEADKLGTPVANIKYHSSDSDAFNNFMWILLSGNTYSEQNISTVYSVNNDNGFAFYYVKNSPGSATMAGGTYCSESELDSIKGYYADIANYDTQNIVCKYAVYTDGEQWSGKRHDSPYINIEETVTLNSGTFERLPQMFDDEQGPVRVDIPQKYDEIDEAAVAGTPIFGYDERELYVYSKDKMAFRHIYLVLINGQVYAVEGSGSGYINGYPLTNDINQYIIDNVFTS
ncbi:MAG: hypothetical protein LBS02_04300 [Hungatella sp.]|jgi:hypothetical protein|nr:hypothetical protein [Hungatella sp.]